MTGPEHYEAAEELLEKANGKVPPTQEQLVARAQVHAMLALAAAVAWATSEKTGQAW